AGAADGSGAPVIEPLDDNNKDLVKGGKVATPNQLAFLRGPSGTQLGLATARQNFHAWSPNNFAVLANSKIGGLRQDLSLMPSLLGDAFTAWANYPAYMEKTKPDPIAPPEGTDGATTTGTTGGTTTGDTTTTTDTVDTTGSSTAITLTNAPRISPE